MRYPVILADPPVPFECWSKSTKPGSGNRSAEDHYPTMTWDDLNALGPYINAVAAEDCCLFLWMCQPLLIETLRMVESWGGWSYRTKAFSWVKTYGDGSSFFVGMGYWTRANTEDVLLFTRGTPRRADKGVYQVLATVETPAVVAPMTRHSEKPEAVQDRIERLVEGPFLELFARRRRLGWTTIGNELDGLDIRASLARLASDQPLPTVRTAIEQHSLLEVV